MMYIRTKDGVYEAVKSHDGHIVGLWNPEVKILNQSENLEELCDRFVVIDKETKEVMNIVAFWEYAKIWVSWKYNIYGAIWTDKGLIYVAKMNEKGEIELI